MEVAAVNVAIKKGAEETTTTMGDANDDDTIENPQNFYSYCITCIERDGACSMRGIRKITQLVIFQFLVMVMAYAFYDDSVLSLMLADRSAFKDPMPRQTFYYKEDDGISLIGGHSTVGTVCGIAACLFLALTIKGDDAESLLTLPVKTMPLTKHGPLRLLLDCVWLGRAHFVPSLAIVGATVQFAACKPVDLVLNATAIAFILELDNLAYGACRRRSKRRYEASSPPAASPMSLGNRGEELVEIYANLLFVSNVCHLWFGFLYQWIAGIIVTPNDRDGASQTLLRSSMITRGLLFGLAEAHLAQLVEARTLPSVLDKCSQFVQAAVWYIYCVAIEGVFGYLALLIFKHVFMEQIGWDSTFSSGDESEAVDEGPDGHASFLRVKACLDSLSKSAECVDAAYNASSNWFGYF